MKDAPAGPAETLREIDFKLVLLRPFKAYYEHLGLALAANLVFFGVLLAAFSFTFLADGRSAGLFWPALLLAWLGLIAPAWFALLALAARLNLRDPAAFGDLLSALSANYLRSLPWALSVLLIYLPLAKGLEFYALFLSNTLTDGTFSLADLLLFFAAGLFGIAALGLVLAQLYVAPLQVLRHEPLGKAYKKAFLLQLDNFPLTVTAWIVLLSPWLVPLGIIWLNLVPGMVSTLIATCYFWSHAALVSVAATQALLTRYNLLDTLDFYLKE